MSVHVDDVWCIRPQMELQRLLLKLQTKYGLKHSFLNPEGKNDLLYAKYDEILWHGTCEGEKPPTSPEQKTEGGPLQTGRARRARWAIASGNYIAQYRLGLVATARVLLQYMASPTEGAELIEESHTLLVFISSWSVVVVVPPSPEQWWRTHGPWRVWSDSDWG